jgi:hypothetical protein
MSESSLEYEAAPPSYRILVREPMTTPQILEEFLDLYRQGMDEYSTPDDEPEEGDRRKYTR